MKLGLFIGASGAPWDVPGQARQVVEAERDGFDSFWFAQVGGSDALSVITLAGPMTSRIEIGTAVVPVFTRHPNVLAQQAHTANNAAGGRLVLGIGPSHRPAVERLGLSYEQVAPRIREYLEVLRALSTRQRVSFEGHFYRLTTAFQMPWAQPFPILLSALAPLMLRAAGELADGTVTWMVGRRTLAEHIAPRITKAAAAAGRPPPRIAVGLPVAVCDSAADGRARAAVAFQGYGQLVNYRRMLDIEGAAGPEDVAVVGTEEEVETQLRAFAKAGATDFLASAFPVGADVEASLSRTRELLKGLVGKI
jgi:F420-dependent oxidoreductase-like protein